MDLIREVKKRYNFSFLDFVNKLISFIEMGTPTWLGRKGWKSSFFFFDIFSLKGLYVTQVKMSSK